MQNWLGSDYYLLQIAQPAGVEVSDPQHDDKYKDIEIPLRQLDAIVERRVWGRHLYLDD